MRDPNFSVGEEVLIYSEDFPAIQGFITTVCEMKYKSFTMSSNKINGGPSWCYKVSPDPWPNINHGWRESALRKKPKPGMSKDALMDSLKKPVTTS